MKKLILLLLVISVTALEAQDYQYFSAKQGIPKAMEIAKEYFHNDSVELYEIMCVRSSLDGSYNTINEDIDPYDDSTGKSLFWYYRFCNNNDSCLFIRIKKTNNDFITDTNWVLKLLYNYRPITIDSLEIDSDSLVQCYNKCIFEFPRRLIFFHLINSAYDYLDYTCHFDNSLIWTWGWSDFGGLGGGYEINISAKSGKCCEISVDVHEKNNNNSPITIKSDPNTDNIIIEPNSDLLQEAELKLYDQVGVLLFSDKLNNKSYQLSTYNYPSGLYILQIKYGGNIITKTVMVVH